MDPIAVNTYLLAKFVEKVVIFFGLVEEKGPECVAALGNAVKVSLLNIIEKEGAEQVGIDVLHQFDQIGVIELKRCGKLNHQLVDTVEKLHKDRTAFVQIVASAKQSAPVGKFVPVLQPLSLHKNLKALSIQFNLNSLFIHLFVSFRNPFLMKIKMNSTS